MRTSGTNSPTHENFLLQSYKRLLFFSKLKSILIFVNLTKIVRFWYRPDKIKQYFTEDLSTFPPCTGKSPKKKPVANPPPKNGVIPTVYRSCRNKCHAGRQTGRLSFDVEVMPAFVVPRFVNGVRWDFCFHFFFIHHICATTTATAWLWCCDGRLKINGKINKFGWKVIAD